MANPYLVDQLDTSAPPGLPAKVLRAQQRKKDDEQRARDEAEKKAQEKHEQRIRWLEIYIKKQKEMMQLIPQASVETQVGNKIQLYDTVYEIKQTYTNSKFPDVKAFYCVEMYLNAEFEWTSCFTPATIRDLKQDSKKHDSYGVSPLEERNTECQSVLVINTSSNEIEFFERTTCRKLIYGFGDLNNNLIAFENYQRSRATRLATKQEFEQAVKARCEHAQKNINEKNKQHFVYLTQQIRKLRESGRDDTGIAQLNNNTIKSIAGYVAPKKK